MAERERDRDRQRERDIYIYIYTYQEDVNGEKLTVKKNGGDFLVPIFTVYAEFFTAYKGHQR